MQFYKMRAECLTDVATLLPTLGRGGLLHRVEILQPDAAYPDVVVTFEHAKDLEYLRCIIATQVDAHLMAQTLQIEEDYTGERGDICYLCGAPSLYPDDSRCEPCRDAVRAAMRNQ